MKKYILAIILFGIYLTMFSQQTKSKFQDNILRSFHYSEPFISEMHSTMNKIEIGYHKDYGPYNLSDKFSIYKRPMVELHLGFDFALYSSKIDKNWDLGISLPVSMHVLEDMWEPITAAVIDVDYRFGSPKIRGIRTIDNSKFIQNISFSWLPIFHECTHLGDELVLAIDARDYPLKRVNVSYEYTELQITINDPNGSKKNNHAFRIGGRYRISNRGFGWFGTESFAVDTTFVNFEQSTRRFEYNVEYQMQRTKGFLASERIMNLLSIDLSNRIKFGIPVFQKKNDIWVAKDLKEKNVFTMNAYFGWEIYGKSKTSHPIGILFHFYKGLNYWGQLRNQGNYGYIGFVLSFRP